jgi:riboflavin kinase/FMN adenylyltransferase
LKLFHSLEEYREYADAHGRERTALTFGKFDGIHIGHKKLICQITDHARALSLKSAVIAIEINPNTILSHEERADYLESLGVDILIECPFTDKFRSTSAEDFIRGILCDTMHAAFVCAAQDLSFGHDRQGDAATLEQAGCRFGFQTKILEMEPFHGMAVSSTRVREALKEGDMELVRELLGRPYPVMGTVRHGRHIGTGIGIPTVNVHPAPEKLLPPDGVYASITHLPGKVVKKGITNIGVRPTVNGKTRKAETTLFDYHEDLYGQTITSELLCFLRPERKFSGLESLKAQIEKDCERAREILKSAPSRS